MRKKMTYPACRICGNKLRKNSPLDHHIRCSLDYSKVWDPMKRPTAVQGAKGKAVTKTSAAQKFTQITDTIFRYQGSGSTPYLVDLEGTDPGHTGKTPTCTCVNWKIERNRMHGDGIFDGHGYRCKHIQQIEAAGNLVKKSTEDKARSEKEAQAVADSIVNDFIRNKEISGEK